MSILKSKMSGAQRAVYGCIATFELPDGTFRSEHFNQTVDEGEVVVVKSRQKRWKRTRTIVGSSALQQAVERADRLDAKIASLTTPETILRDLQGTRAELEVRSDQKNPADTIRFPELAMLGKVGRRDLFVYEQSAEGRRRAALRRITERAEAG